MNKGEETRTLGEYVRSRRLAKGFTLQDAENASGVDGSYWSKLELGEYQSPNPRYLGAIARALEIQAEDLYGLAGYDIPERLPEFAPYLRSKYALPPEAIADLEKYYAQLRSYYGIPEDQPVFPPIPKEDRAKRPPKSRRKATGRNSDAHPWRTT